MRLQVGWLDEHPLRIPCGRCGILFTGKVVQDQQKAKLKYEIHNASCIAETEPEFYIEASGELPSQKLTRLPGGPFTWAPPPFFKAIWAMGDDKYLDFQGRAIRFLYMTRNEWPKVRRINELWLARNFQYLPDEIHTYLSKKQFPANSELEYLRGVHQLNLLFFLPIQDHQVFEKSTRIIFKSIDRIGHHAGIQFRHFVAEFEEKGLCPRYEQKILDMMDRFVTLFPNLLPGFALRFYGKSRTETIRTHGVTTASFDDVKHYYSDAYEVIAEILPFVQGFNNLYHRHDYKKMVTRRKDVVTLDDYFGKPTGDRLQFFDGSQQFDDLIIGGVDNKLRNAISHKSYRYDSVSQTIAYYPSGGEDQGEEKKTFLVSFIEQCWELRDTLVNLSELVYQARKYYFVLVKKQRSVHPSVFGISRKELDKYWR